MTSPGKYASAFDALPDDVSSLLTVVQGLFVHSDFLDIHGLAGSAFSTRSRETLPVEKRLDQIFQISNQALQIARPVDHRAVGTCRDYALMMCGLLWHKSFDARVRCGFAQYFVPGRYEDHWLCEYRCADTGRWVRVDAQMDEAHRDHLAIAFDPSDVPDGAFVTAVEAWDLVRTGKAAPELFGHGDAAGAWFLWVNLARDYFALCGQEVSPWDSWRSALGRDQEIDPATQETCERIAAAIRNVECAPEEMRTMLRLQPFWSAAR
ncbi:transglutaminase [Denitrobaculum tricleocarpae]|uniref:Transglutaminase n=1 Tax=Denitrobaculum tricleocarpae TaxID=2591009 RepID=A0A545TYA0_9PROT|nr:transglutaminase [Denitrobaculum tricleocarpae]TQV82208.1 transglutaminase [Denitrobaculum tricleocarpae]